MELQTKILVVGGGLGGIAGAIAAARLGVSVILTEELDWLGGQLTTQGVPFDEHPHIEQFGCTQTYRQLRDGIRQYYRDHYPLTPKARADRYLNPGAALVARVSGEPKVGVAVLEAMLAPYESAGLIRICHYLKPVATDVDGDRIISITFEDVRSGDNTVITADYVLDATETGELLPLSGTEYVTGAEGQDKTGEFHAYPGTDPQNMQSITWCYGLEYDPDEDYTIAKPEEYDFWSTYQAEFQTAPQFSMERPHMKYELFPNPGSGRFSLWQFRRVLYKGNFPERVYPSDLTIMNCTQNDYWLGSIIDVPEEKVQHHTQRAKQLGLSFLYWLQTEFPREDGKQGYPGLKLAPQVMGTHDGFAKSVYIREARRIKAEFTILEEHVGVEARGNVQGAEKFDDTVGIGNYWIDIHPTTGGNPSLNIPNWPFQIPLGALIPIRMQNLLPACKNIGTTHMSNSCYRLHPIEWNIGEAAGAIAAYSLLNKTTPRAIRNTETQLRDFQSLLIDLGIELHWPGLEPGASYYKHFIKQPGWYWGETDRSDRIRDYFSV